MASILFIVSSPPGAAVAVVVVAVAVAVVVVPVTLLPPTPEEDQGSSRNMPCENEDDATFARDYRGELAKCVFPFPFFRRGAASILIWRRVTSACGLF